MSEKCHCCRMKKQKNVSAKRQKSQQRRKYELWKFRKLKKRLYLLLSLHHNGCTRILYVRGKQWMRQQKMTSLRKIWIFWLYAFPVPLFFLVRKFCLVPLNFNGSNMNKPKAFHSEFSYFLLIPFLPNDQIVNFSKGKCFEQRYPEWIR